MRAGRSVSAMARPLDLRQQRELTAFVNALYEAAGYTTIAEWARDSDYPASNLSNLRNGKGGVDGYNLLRLIRSAASRTEFDPEQLAIGLAQATDYAASSESIHHRLGVLEELVTQALELLEPAVEDAPQVRGGGRSGRRRGA